MTDFGVLKKNPIVPFILFLLKQQNPTKFLPQEFVMLQNKL